MGRLPVKNSRQQAQQGGQPTSEHQAAHREPRADGAEGGASEVHRAVVEAHPAVVAWLAPAACSMRSQGQD
jgi:hypothetical protein